MIDAKVPRDQPFEKVLKDGVILCKLMNRIRPGSIKKVNTKGGNFALMENIAAFQKGMKAVGVPEEEIFQTVDLFEARNVKSVVKAIHALGRTLQNQKFDGPTLGPKMSEENIRGFSEEENRKMRDAQISLQSGSNKGASQAGVSMGKQRMIAD